MVLLQDTECSCRPSGTHIHKRLFLSHCRVELHVRKCGVSARTELRRVSQRKLRRQSGLGREMHVESLHKHGFRHSSSLLSRKDRSLACNCSGSAIGPHKLVQQVLCG